MLRKIRLTLAIFFWLLVTWLLVDFTGTAHQYLGWMAKMQFMPALLAVNVGVLLFLVVLTLLFGRIYCSVICPLGVMQDAIAWCRRKRNKYIFSLPHSKVRHGFLLATAALMLAGMGWLAGLLLPYSTYGRIVGTLVAPLYRMGNNVLASVAAHYDSYAFYEVDVWLKSVSALVVSVAVWALIAVLAWRFGRLWCNTVCPVGTLLGFLSRHAVYRPAINQRRCNSCGLCERNCKSQCINSRTHEIDLSRCVMCGNCMEACRKGALTLTSSPAASAEQPAPVPAPKAVADKPRSNAKPAKKTKAAEKEAESTSNAERGRRKPATKTAPEKAAKPTADKPAKPIAEKAARSAEVKTAGPAAEGSSQPADVAGQEAEGEKKDRRRRSRRTAIATTAMLLTGGTLVRAQKKAEPKTTDGGFADITPKEKPSRQRPVLPPGAFSARHLQAQCTACQLCITSCPNDVLRPSTSLSSLLQPEVSYERGYCRPECNRCSQVCPTGAIQPITVEQRTAVQVGRAVWVKERCIASAEGKPCGSCARHCPAGAIQLVPASDKYRRGDHGRWYDAEGHEVDGRTVPMIPVVDEEKCIGCGACENLCPVSPYSAIYVEGNDVQRDI